MADDKWAAKNKAAVEGQTCNGIASLNEVFIPGFTLAHLGSLPTEPGKVDTATAQAMIRDAEIKIREMHLTPDPNLMHVAQQALVDHHAPNAAQTLIERQVAFYDAVRAFRRNPGPYTFDVMGARWRASTGQPPSELFAFIVETLRPGGLPRDGPFVWCSPEDTEDTEDTRDTSDPTDTETNTKMATHAILTPPGVSSFLNLVKPRAIVEGGEERFSLTIIFDKAAQQRPEFAALQRGIDDALKERWPAKLPAGLLSPFHDGAEKAGQYEGYKAGDIFISPWSKNKPGAVNNRKEDILTWDEFYAGWIVRANVRPFAYDRAGKRGASLFLDSVQFLKPGKRLDGRKPATESFPDDDEGDEEPV